MKDFIFSSGYASILRELQYAELAKLSLQGKVLDIGGSRKSGYIELPTGEHTWTIANYGDQHPGADIFFNAEEKFPIDDVSFDNVTMVNVIEHIFNTHNVFQEVARVLKPGGLFVATMPFMHHIHGSPDDFVRYTASAYRKFAEKYNFEVIYLENLGEGIFALFFQTLTIKRVIPIPVLFSIVKFIFISLDRLFSVFPFYKALAGSTPLGYFWIMKKK